MYFFIDCTNEIAPLAILEVTEIKGTVIASDGSKHLKYVCPTCGELHDSRVLT